MSKKERGRPMCSHHVRIVPEYRDTPDMEKLGTGSDLGSGERLPRRKERGNRPQNSTIPTRSASSPADAAGRRAA